jgi:hypothetical protein
VFISLFLVEKVPLNCTSAVKSLLHLSMIAQKVSVYCIFHTRRTGLNCCLSTVITRGLFCPHKIEFFYDNLPKRNQTRV